MLFAPLTMIDIAAPKKAPAILRRRVAPAHHNRHEGISELLRGAARDIGGSSGEGANEPPPHNSYGPFAQE